ncbi:MAG: beta-galactosidase [Candidatus Sumerlaeota bacterium]|nr:beta-galactosidase [Candidatus Sumerlaeota bacterium]
MISSQCLYISAGTLWLAAFAHGAERPRLAVFRDAGVPIRNSAPSDPDYLARLAGEAGWGVQFVSGADLANPQTFSRDRFDAIVLPYGEGFPREAVENFRVFVEAGGSFFSTGGYAFNFLYPMKGDGFGENLLSNPEFEKEADGWTSDPEKPSAGAVAGVDSKTFHQGHASARLSIGSVSKEKSVTFFQELPTPGPGAQLRLTSWARTRGLGDGSALMEISFWRQDGTIFENMLRKSKPAGSDAEWHQLTLSTYVPKDAARIRVALVLNGAGEAWFDDVDMRAAPRVLLNTRLGTNTGSGILSTNPDQIGVFDDSYPLAGVAELRPSDGQFVLDADTKTGLDLKSAPPLKGWAASAVIGVSKESKTAVLRRWTPVLDGYDSSGERLGPVLSIVHNLAPPFRGSFWAIAGVTNRDLFAADNPEMGKIFTRVLDALRPRVVLREPKTNFYSYHQGEPVEIRVPAFNLGLESVNARLELRVSAEDLGNVVAQESFEKALPGDSEHDFALRWAPERFDDDFYTVVATLEIGGRPVDRTATGFVVWSPDVLKQGFPLKWADNYFRANDRPVFLTGTNQYFVVWDSDEETPLKWQQTFSRLHDLGIHAMRILHLTKVIGPVGHNFDFTHPPEASLRRLDAIVQMLQKYQIALFLSLHEGISQVPDEGQLERERQWAEFVARRYADASGLMFDVQNEPTVLAHPDAHMTSLYREFLKKRYQTDEAFAEAYEKPGLKIEDAPMPPNTEPWASRAGIDRQDFSVDRQSACLRANAQGVHDGAPGKPVTNGYLPKGGAADPWLANQWLDFSNYHAYTTYDNFRSQLKFIDQRFAGRGMSIGEFSFAQNPGLRETAEQVIGWTHTNWAATEPGDDAGVDCHLTTALQSFGLGGSMACNWHAYDPDTFLFCFGLLHNGQHEPRDMGTAFGFAGLFLRNFAPRFESPEVYYVVPDNHRTGGERAKVNEAVARGMDILMGCSVDFASINESSLASLPKSAKLLVWPIPYCPEDETVERLIAFVKDGGRLLVTGDFSYDRWRKRSRVERLKTLAGVEFVKENYPNIDSARGKPAPCEIPLASGKAALDFAPCIQVEPAGAKVLLSAGGQPALCEFSLGKGKTYFSPEPYELRHTWKDTALYEYVLERESVARLPVQPIQSQSPVLRQPTLDGEQVFVVCNRGNDPTTVSLTQAKSPVQVTVAPQRESLFAFNKADEIIAAGFEGACDLGGRWMTSNGRLMLIGADKKPLEQTKQIVVFLLGATELSLPSTAEWREPRAEIGEMVDGRWKPMGQATIQRGDKTLRIETSAVHRLRIALIAEAGEMEGLRTTVAGWIQP